MALHHDLYLKRKYLNLVLGSFATQKMI